ncbi:MAG: hypothetical protein WC010_01715 [Candidatus Absconditabacterales bacterium]
MSFIFNYGLIAMKNIEVELRSFVDEEKYRQLINFFDQKAKFLKEDNQITHYFTGGHDLRIQKNNFFSKIWMKKGALHDDHREEIEIKFDKEDFDKLQQLFINLGYEIEITWIRKCLQFDRDGIEVSLDYTKGYGYVIELEILSTDLDKDENLEILRQKFAELEITITPKEEFKTKYEWYKTNWKTLIE